MTRILSNATQSYNDAVRWIYERIDYERIPPVRVSPHFQLERVRRQLALIGSPQERIRAVHIAGTKGKGSTAAMVDSIMRASKIRCGLFTSPHIEVFEERMTVDGCRPEAAELTFLVAELQRRLQTADDDLRRDPPTYFEVATLLAWMYFDRKQVELVVLETGLGGRLDCTNVCSPLVTVITNISLDHTSILGHTLEKIAFEKAGIIKSGVPLITGVSQPQVIKLCDRRAVALNAPRIRLQREIQLEVRSSFRDRQIVSVTTPHRQHEAMELPLAGAHQAKNAALAVAVADQLSTSDDRITASTIRSGLQWTVWPLRFEVIPGSPVIILDAAHNPDAALAVVDTLNNGQWAERPRVLVFGASRDKDVRQMLAILLPHFDHAILTLIRSNPRSCPPGELATMADRVAKETTIQTAESAENALQLAHSATGSAGLICVTGSVFLAAECRGHHFDNKN
ncbi:MAG: bifunctional folylpolyglutamate synthase/dihydrofolate synthase [Fuerstiella sp.]|nr:bifunctional folylpolyglutamate synthase/dihydrofolate synthase [Fuerstiella sp.]